MHSERRSIRWSIFSANLITLVLASAVLCLAQAFSTGALGKFVGT